MENPFPHGLILLPWARIQILGFANLLHGLFLQIRVQRHNVVHVLLFGVEKESAGVAEGAVIVGPGGVGEEKTVFCPGKGHIAKPPLLLQFFSCVGTLPWEDALGHTAQEHHRKFQALGGVDGHEFHGLGFLRLVHVGKEGRMVQVVAQGNLLPCLSGKIVNGLLQFRQVVQTFLLAVGPQHILIAALIQNARKQVRQVHAIEDCPVFFNKPHILLGPAAPEQVRFQIGNQRFVEAAPIHGSKFLQRRNSGPANAPAGLVDRAKEADVVSGVDHPQVAQYVLNLLALIEFHAGIEDVGNFAANKGFFQRPGDIVGPVENAHGGIGFASIVECPQVCGNPVRFQLAGFRVEIQWLPVVRAHGGELFF